MQLDQQRPTDKKVNTKFHTGTIDKVGDGDTKQPRKDSELSTKADHELDHENGLELGASVAVDAQRCADGLPLCSRHRYSTRMCMASRIATCSACDCGTRTYWARLSLCRSCAVQTNRCSCCGDRLSQAVNQALDIPIERIGNDYILLSRIRD